MDRPGGNVAICEVNLSSLIPMQETEPELKEAGEVPKAGSKRKGQSKGDGKESKDAQPKKRWKKTVLGQGTFMESSGRSQGKKKKAPNPKTALKQIKETLNDKAMLPVPPPLPVPSPLPPPPSTPPPPPPPSPSPPLPPPPLLPISPVVQINVEAGSSGGSIPIDPMLLEGVSMGSKSNVPLVRKESDFAVAMHHGGIPIYGPNNNPDPYGDSPEGHVNIDLDVDIDMDDDQYEQ